MRKRFLRNNAHRLKRVGLKWRRPRGEQNKTRIDIRGEQPSVKVGYKKTEKPQIPVISNENQMREIVKAYGRKNETSVAEQRSMHSGASGLLKEIIIASNVGARRVESLRKEAHNLGLKILNKRKLERVEKRVAEIKKLREEKTKKEDKVKTEKKSSEASEEGKLSDRTERAERDRKKEEKMTDTTETTDTKEDGS